MNNNPEDRIILKDLEFWGRHGANPKEQEKPQPFLVTIIIQIDLTQPCRSDNLGDTLDYGILYKDLKQLFENHHYQLLEKLAQEAADIVLKDPLACAVTVQVEKTRATMGDDLFCAVVEINRKR